MLDSDHRCAELEELLEGLSPRDELIHRFALRDISPHCRGDYRFTTKTSSPTSCAKPEPSPIV